MKQKEAFEAKRDEWKVRRISRGGPENNSWTGRVGKITAVRAKSVKGKPFNNVMCTVKWDDGSFGSHPPRMLERLPDPSCFNLAVRGKRKMRI